jgi:hypothetical protein
MNQTYYAEVVLKVSRNWKNIGTRVLRRLMVECRI